MTLSLLVACCVHDTGAVRNSQRPRDLPVEIAAAPSAPPRPTGQAAAAVDAVQRWADGRRSSLMGSAVLDMATGELALGREAGQPMYSASLIKLFVAVDVVQRAGHGQLPEQARDWIRRALGASDDQAMNALWSGFDGAGAIQRLSAQLGLQDMRAPENPPRWGEAYLSARDVLRVYQFILTGLPTAERDFLLDALAAAPARAADGFDQHFGLATDPRMLVKAGWMCCQRGRTTLHTAGVTSDRRFVVVLLSSQPADGYARASQELTEAASAALAALR